MKKYVLAFAFDEKRENIVLIHKQRPDWQKDKWNGVGGKKEDSDRTMTEAMCREFKEETGVDTFLHEWDIFCQLKWNNDIMGGSAEVVCMRMFSDKIFSCATTEEEEVRIIPLTELNKYNKIPHVEFLIPMALSKDIELCQINML